MRTLIRTLLLCLALLGAVPAAAAASSSQVALFQDDRQLLREGPDVRDRTLDELRSLGVDAIKFQLDWNAAAPGDKTRPAGLGDGRDPAAYDWTFYDGLVSAAQARGFRVMAALSPPAPGWATAKRGDSLGVDRPSPTWFGRFAEAAGKHFSGIDLWTMWNEPNHPGFLYPQATKRRAAYAPHLYRRLVVAGVAGLRASGHSGDTILFGELLPIGNSRLFRKNTIKPLRFLREFFCIGKHSGACRHYKPISGVSGFAYHPYTRAKGPRVRLQSPDDATIAYLSRVTRALDSARARRRIRGRKLPIWNTEFGFQSNPPDPFQAKLSRIPAFMSESEWISYRNPRVASYSQYTMVDTPVARRGDLTGTWQGGLRFANGANKPGALEAYRQPIFARILGPNAVEVWGDARSGGAGAKVQLQERSGKGAFKDLGSPFTVGNSRGYFTRRFRLKAARKRSFRFVEAGQTSRVAKAVFR
jgi:hypothetical protein